MNDYEKLLREFIAALDRIDELLHDENVSFGDFVCANDIDSYNAIDKKRELLNKLQSLGS